MVVKEILTDHIGKKITLISPAKNAPMPLKPVDLQALEEDFFEAISSKGIIYYVPYTGIRFLSVASTGILQVQLM